MSRILLTLLILSFLIFPYTEQITYTNIDNTLLDIEQILETIYELSKEEYKGRLAGTKGNHLAQEYIIKQYETIGLIPAQEEYKQPFTHKVIHTQAPAQLKTDQKEYTWLVDFKVRTIWPGSKINGISIGSPHLLTKEDLDNPNLKDHILLIDTPLLEELGLDPLITRILYTRMNPSGIILNIDNRNSGHYIVSRCIRNQELIQFKDTGPIIMYVTKQTFQELTQAQEIHMEARYTLEEVTSHNLIGYIPGTNQEEYIIISAHYDHVGDNKNGTYNPGALDNASGVAALLEIARILKTNHQQPEKTIIFITFDAEEVGLLGSKHYTENPIFPLKNTTVINLDMLGSKLPLSLEGFNNDLQKTLATYAQKLEIPTTYRGEVRSDSLPFHEKGIPAITIIHYDRTYLHTINDLPEHIDKDSLKQAIQLILYYLDKEAYSTNDNSEHN